jgi:glycosyltransferase involved in cell wall biosynthesis
MKQPRSESSVVSQGGSIDPTPKRYGIVVEQLRRPVPGGIGTYARGLLQGLRSGESELAQNESILLIASGTADEPDPLAELGPLRSPLRGLPIGHRITQRGWDSRLFAAPPGLHVVHATSFAQPPRRVSLKRSERMRTMYVHDLAWRTHPDAYPEAGRIWHERALARALREVDAFFVPSKATEEALRAASRQSIEVRVIAEGCDHLPLSGSSAALPHDLDVIEPVSATTNAGYLLTVSTREPRKNLSRLLQAYTAARGEFRDLGVAIPTLRIVGPQGWTNADGDPTLPAQLPEGVELIGAVTDAELARQLQDSRAFLYVPLVEGFGLPPLEAMRSGAAVVCSPVPSVTEASPDAALVVDPLDVPSIAGGIVRVLTDEAFRGRLISAGTLLSAQRSWSICAAQHLAYWRTVS